MKLPSFPPAQPDRSAGDSASLSATPLESTPNIEIGEIEKIDQTIHESIHELEQAFQLLKTRHAQIQTDRQCQQILRDRKDQIEQQLQHTTSARIQHQLKQDLKQIRQQLETLEVALESQLFSWTGLKEVFWQAVRFGGLGMMIGWVLRSWMR
jgi:flagellar motility protein MotE (MotC chaperone)